MCIRDSCASLIDDADPRIDLTTASPWFEDQDDDGYGSSDQEMRRCVAPAGYVSNDTDCDDEDALVSPVGVEICDLQDNDCDDSVDDEDIDVTGQPTWYLDNDEDGYGVSGESVRSCLQPEGYVDAFGDCDDTTSGIGPHQREVCNSIDDDCDGFSDDTDSSLDSSTATIWYRDNDDDRYGDSRSSLRRCRRPTGYASSGNDCNDERASINPAASEVCDGLDNDCDSQGDESLTCTYRLYSHHLDSGICADDDLYIDLKGTRIYTDIVRGPSCTSGPIEFTAKPGDEVRVQAVDSGGYCRYMNNVYLAVADDSGENVTTKLMLENVERTCGHRGSTIPFVDETFEIPGIF